jgi:hypothetical protein
VRKTLFLLLIVHSSWLTASSQYWQQQVNYTIDVSLNDKDHSLDGFEKIVYINNSPDTLKFIWFHVWPNAYKNDRTAFSDQMLENGNTKFYFSDKEQKGYINRLEFKVNNTTAQVLDHPQHIDIVKLVLPVPLPPGQQTIITTPFHVKLPYNFSRGGHEGQGYQISQWYPKPAVYDQTGWHPMPYLSQGEFYSEFGNFDVSITLPENYIVAATGELQNEEEKKSLKQRAEIYEKDLKIFPLVKKTTPTKPGNKPDTTTPASSSRQKTLRYTQDNIHDFAWFADKRFVVNYDTCRLASGKTVDVYTFYTKPEAAYWNNSVKDAKDAIRHYSDLVGEYPYKIVSVVQGPASFGGGMEYPTITVISPINDPKTLDRVIAHEIGHNWFYGILASNERLHPWMDEGMNSYYDTKYAQKKDKQLDPRGTQALLETMIVEKKDQPIETASENFNEWNYGLIAYYKTSKWMEVLEAQLGTEVFNKAMQEYYRRWQFKHPHPADLQKVLEEVSGKDLDSAFALLNQKGKLPGLEKKGIALQGPKGLILGTNEHKNSAITILPALGFNSYDKLMAGIALTNLRLPPNHLQFMVAPMYGIGSKTFTGIGFINYSFYPKGIFRKIDIGVNGSTFTADQFTDPDDNEIFLGFQKIVPGIQFTLKEKNPRSPFYRFIRFKSFLIGEDQLRFSRDSIFTPTDTIIVEHFDKEKENRVLNQLQFVVENNRALYPYRGELKIEQGKGFIRSGFTGNYFFNYPKSGGLDVRLFAGKFFYTSPKTSTTEFSTARYQLNMLAPNGYEDYTYSDYFVGRNEFTGVASQQVMEKDGAMKLRLEQFEGDPQFRSRVLSDDWLIAANLSTSLPTGIIPQFIPLKIFADIATSAGMWDKSNTNGKFAFVAGLQLSFIKNTINIYAPLLYSSEFKNLLKSDGDNNKFSKKISFSINISNFSLRKIDRKLDF